MKRIILAIALLWCTVAISAPDAMAKARPHKKHAAHIASALHPNIVKPTPRPEDESSVLAMMTDSSCDAQCMISDTSTFSRTSNTAYLCPSLDPASMCDINTRFGALSNSITVNPLAGTLIDMNENPSSIDLTPTSVAFTSTTESGSINNYYYAKAVYEPPTTVTIGGFSVPVKGNPLYR